MKKGKKTRRVSRQHSNRTQKKEIKREKEKSPPVSFFFSKRNNTHGHFVRRGASALAYKMAQRESPQIGSDFTRMSPGPSELIRRKEKKTNSKTLMEPSCVVTLIFYFCIFPLGRKKGRGKRKKQEGKRVGQQSRVETQPTIYQKPGESLRQKPERGNSISKQTTLSPLAFHLFFIFFYIYLLLLTGDFFIFARILSVEGRGQNTHAHDSTAASLISQRYIVWTLYTNKGGVHTHWTKNKTKNSLGL